MPRVPLKK